MSLNARPRGATGEPGEQRCPRARRGPESKRRFRRLPSPKRRRSPGADAKPKRLSALDAAAQVLQKSGQAMRSIEMIAAMAEQGLWTSPKGKTPHATLYAAILREIGTKAKDARFRKVERGKFEFVG